MPISFQCPDCAKSFNVRDELAGKKARCKCGATILIPQPAAPAQQSPPVDPLLGPLAANQPAVNPLMGSVPPAQQPADPLMGPLSQAPEAVDSLMGSVISPEQPVATAEAGKKSLHIAIKVGAGVGGVAVLGLLILLVFNFSVGGGSVETFTVDPTQFDESSFMVFNPTSGDLLAGPASESGISSDYCIFIEPDDPEFGVIKGDGYFLYLGSGVSVFDSPVVPTSRKHLDRISQGRSKPFVGADVSEKPVYLYVGDGSQSVFMVTEANRQESRIVFQWRKLDRPLVWADVPSRWNAAETAGPMDPGPTPTAPSPTPEDSPVDSAETVADRQPPPDRPTSTSGLQSEQVAIAALEKLGLPITRGDDGNVRGVGHPFKTSPITDSGLVHLKGLTNLKILYLDESGIADAGLLHLKGLTSLEYLSLRNTQITGAGFVHLEGLKNLETLNLLGTKVTNASLVHLKGLMSLESLELVGTQITDAGLAHLKGLTSLHTLVLGVTDITDAGLLHLQGLPRLRTLDLNLTQVTDAGLAHLKGMTRLRSLSLRQYPPALRRPKITDAGVADLQRALPNCEISR